MHSYELLTDGWSELPEFKTRSSVTITAEVDHCLVIQTCVIKLLERSRAFGNAY